MCRRFFLLLALLHGLGERPCDEAVFFVGYHRCHILFGVESGQVCERAVAQGAYFPAVGGRVDNLLGFLILFEEFYGEVARGEMLVDAFVGLYGLLYIGQ